MLRTQLYADPHGRFVHDLVLESCRRFPAKTAIVDASCNRRISYAEYGETVESLARGFIAAGLKPGEVVAIFLANCWEFCAAYHASTLAGAIATLLNPTYREREARYQLENSGASFLIADGCSLNGINLSRLPNLRRVYSTRQPAAGTEPFASLLHPVTANFPAPDKSSDQTLAALPYSSGTTGLPKGVMLSHHNLVANVFQFIGPNATPLCPGRHRPLFPAALSHLRPERDAESGTRSRRNSGAGSAIPPATSSGITGAGKHHHDADCPTGPAGYVPGR